VSRPTAVATVIAVAVVMALGALAGPILASIGPAPQTVAFEPAGRFVDTGVERGDGADVVATTGTAASLSGESVDVSSENLTHGSWTLCAARGSSLPPTSVKIDSWCRIRGDGVGRGVG
jgi:hypothetical protein